MGMRVVLRRQSNTIYMWFNNHTIATTVGFHIKYTLWICYIIITAFIPEWWFLCAYPSDSWSGRFCFHLQMSSPFIGHVMTFFGTPTFSTKILPPKDNWNNVYNRWPAMQIMYGTLHQMTIVHGNKANYMLKAALISINVISIRRPLQYCMSQQIAELFWM
jgi:hypothetical protein